MNVKLREIFEAREAFERLLMEPMDFKLAYRMRKLARQVISELQDIEDARLRLVEEYADEQTDEDLLQGAPRQVRARLPDFRRDFAAFLEMEIEMDAALIPFDCLEGLKLSPVELVRIEKFLAATPDLEAAAASLTQGAPPKGPPNEEG